MQLQRVHFDTDAVERFGMGAGIVPISVDPHGTVHVLLGRERFMPHWKGSCRWSGFEGSRKGNGEWLSETALREFCEETLGVVQDRAAIARTLDDGDYWLRIVLRICDDRRPERYHATYVVPVAWNPDIPKRFLNTRLDIEHVDRAAQEWRYARDADADGPEARRQRLRLEQMMISHEGVVVSRDPDTAAITSVEVNRDHMEKDQVRWWSERDLRAAMVNRGHLGTDRFRPYFLPVLQTLLQELQVSSPFAETGTPHAPRTRPPGCLRCDA
jgi:hypothetical protein